MQKFIQEKYFMKNPKCIISRNLHLKGLLNAKSLFERGYFQISYFFFAKIERVNNSYYKCKSRSFLKTKIIGKLNCIKKKSLTHAIMFGSKPTSTCDSILNDQQSKEEFMINLTVKLARELYSTLFDPINKRLEQLETTQAELNTKLDLLDVKKRLEQMQITGNETALTTTRGFGAAATTSTTTTTETTQSRLFAPGIRSSFGGGFGTSTTNNEN